MLGYYINLCDFEGPKSLAPLLLIFSVADISEGCLLQLCYEFFTKQVTEDTHVQYLIHMQLVQLVSNISVVEGGPAVLFESTCSCCMEVGIIRMYKRQSREI